MLELRVFPVLSSGLSRLVESPSRSTLGCRLVLREAGSEIVTFVSGKLTFEAAEDTERRLDEGSVT